jgi:hypothetical protein
MTLESGKPLFLDIPGTRNGMVRYVAFPGRGGYQRAPDFRVGRRHSCAVEALFHLAEEMGSIDKQELQRLWQAATAA